MVRSLLEELGFTLNFVGSGADDDCKETVGQGNVGAPLIVNVDTQYHTIHPITSSFEHADDLAIAAQDTNFNVVEETLFSALVLLTE